MQIFPQKMNMNKKTINKITLLKYASNTRPKKEIFRITGTEIDRQGKR